jgi:hypothetical protein
MVMFRKTILINVVAVGLIALLGSVVSAAITCTSASWGCKKSQCAIFELKGGAKPGSCFILGDIRVVEACLVCVNPGGDEDVREGVGGISDITYLESTDSAFITANKLKIVNMCLPYTVDEFNSYEYKDFCSSVLGKECLTYQDAQEAFEKFYEINSSNCVNSNWRPFQYIITTVEVIGDVWCGDCTFDENNNPIGDSCEKQEGGATACCSTEMECRYWDCENAEFLCTEGDCQ